jgi:hypothetical protein
MPINADKPQLWKADTRASVDQFNNWFQSFAPRAFREARKQTVDDVARGLSATNDLQSITPDVILKAPAILQTLRMATCPPLARDRLIGLADTTKNLVGRIEKGKVPPKLSDADVRDHLDRICGVLSKMLDVDIFPWIEEQRNPSEEERYRSSTIVADRLCGAVAEPIVRNAQEKRQLAAIEHYLVAKGYRHQPHATGKSVIEMEPGTFCFRLNLEAGSAHGGDGSKTVRIPVDAVIQPKSATLPHLPLLIEAKSAGDFTNVNKRRKEEATKVNQLRGTYGEQVTFALFLCGYFDAAYLGYEAAEGIDWVWEHRISDLDQLGI